MEDNNNDLFDLDEDFEEQNISNNEKPNQNPEKEKSKDNEPKEEKKENKDTQENLIHEENQETKENSEKKEKLEFSKKIEKFDGDNDNGEEYDSNEEKDQENSNEEKEEENENENENDQEDSEAESQEKEEKEKEKEEDLLKLNFQERHEKMQKWAIEDDLDVSAFSKIENPPIKFPFELDEFQKRSILRLENHQNVLVCAHTSSGKTVVAEYGIALGKRHSKRVLYTSPIKALSNQKYREFKKKFEDVGILTGDVSINPEAQCLIMTTEILQNSLYNNSELLNQVEWVVFDEIHYINDNERGHVWEEILILLPKGIGIIMLSATVPNYMEFAQWVGDIKETKVYVQNTLKRVVPLQHTLFIDSKNVYKVKEKDKVNKAKIEQAFHFLEDEKKYQQHNNKKNREMKNKENEYYENIMYFEQYKQKSNKKENWRKNNIKKSYQKYGYNKNQPYQPKITKMHHKIEEIVDYLDNQDLCPAVIFVFSIKKITEYAKMLSLKNLVPLHQQKEISNFYESVVNSMPLEDRRIPQVQELREILQSGIGMHHAGLLPILKETIEVLYSRGLIKILFATTSFSIGLNMPTRTVVFTDIYKFNDTCKEILSSSEYLQMCGRAGRRGIDEIGNVFILLTELSNKHEKDEVINMLEGKGDNVVSKFRICYRTLLSFFTRNIKDMNEFFRESFLESNMTQQIPQKIKEIEDLKIKQKLCGKFKCEKCEKELQYLEINNEEAKENKNNETINVNVINIINESENKNKNKDELNNNQIINNKEKNNFDIEKYPVAKFYKCLKKYKELSNEIFTNETIYNKLSSKAGRILKVRKEISNKKKNKKVGEIDDGIYVMLIEAYKDKYFGSLWCLCLSGVIKKINKKISYNGDICQKKGIFGKYKYIYKEYRPEDVIEAYEYPLEIKLKGKKNNVFWKKDKSDYYYIADKNIFIDALKELKRLNDDSEKLKILKQEISFCPLNYKDLVKNIEFHKKIEERNQALEESRNNACLNCPNSYEHLKQYQNFEETKNKIEELIGGLNPENLEHYKEFQTRLEILQDLKYVNEDNSLTLKGKAAREIGTTDCVLVTELLTSDILTSLTDENVVGFISGFASNKNEVELDEPYISKDFSTAVQKFVEIYNRIEDLEKSKDFQENKYNRRMTFEFSEAMISWMSGKPFQEILNLTELEEGKLYNLIMRIFLMLEEMSNFYSIFGNVEQSKRFLEIKSKL